MESKGNFMVFVITYCKPLTTNYRSGNACLYFRFYTKLHEHNNTHKRLNHGWHALPHANNDIFGRTTYERHEFRFEEKQKPQLLTSFF